jgi:predicted O-methyltransferase YrrM
MSRVLATPRREGVPLNGIDLRPALAVPGWMERDELAWLAAMARHAQVVVEIGSHQGRSTLALADHCPGLVYAIDPWEGPCLREDGTTAPNDWAVYDAFATHLALHLASGRVVALQMSSVIALRQLLAAHVLADLVFIDGDHRHEAVAADLALGWLLVRSGGRLAGHDYHNATWPGVTSAVDDRFPTGVQTLNGIWWVEKP